MLHFYGGQFPADDQHGPRFTEVVLDMRDNGGFMTGSGEGFVVESGGIRSGLQPWLPPGPIQDGMVLATMPGHDGKEFIEARMMITPPGEDMPRMFPVMFFKHEWPNDTGHVSYRADTSFKLNDSVLSFAGEIKLVNTSITRANVSDDLYNNEISSGQTIWHQATVTGSPTSFNFDLKWNNSADQMRVMVYSPDGKVLGPYYDNSDGIQDGSINMNISNPTGVAKGAWSFKVTDTGVTGKDEYYLKTW